MHKTLLKLFLNSCSDNLKSKIENPKWLGPVAIIVTLAMCGAAVQAQQPGKIPRIGFVAGTGDTNNPGPFVDAFRRGLHDLGLHRGEKHPG